MTRTDHWYRPSLPRQGLAGGPLPALSVQTPESSLPREGHPLPSRRPCRSQLQQEGSRLDLPL